MAIKRRVIPQLIVTLHNVVLDSGEVIETATLRAQLGEMFWQERNRFIPREIMTYARQHGQDYQDEFEAMVKLTTKYLALYRNDGSYRKGSYNPYLENENG